jgi:hypothetical protein
MTGVHLQNDFTYIKGHNLTDGCAPNGLRTKSNPFKIMTSKKYPQYKYNNEQIKGTQQWNLSIEIARNKGDT